MNTIYDNGTHKIESSGAVDNSIKPIRNITKRSFMKRIDQLDRIAIRKSTDDYAIDIHEDLKSASNVDLDDADTVNGVNYLISQNLLPNTDIDALFNDGTEAEKYP